MGVSPESGGSSATLAWWAGSGLRSVALGQPWGAVCPHPAWNVEAAGIYTQAELSGRSVAVGYGGALPDAWFGDTALPVQPGVLELQQGEPHAPHEDFVGAGHRQPCDGAPPTEEEELACGGTTGSRAICPWAEPVVGETGEPLGVRRPSSRAETVAWAPWTGC